MPMSVEELNAAKNLDERTFAIYQAEATRRQKSVGIAYALWFFFGWLGIHKFYLRSWLGYVYLFAVAVPIFMLIRTATAISPGRPPGVGDDMTFVLSLVSFLGMVFLAVSLLVDLFTIPRQVEDANFEMRMSLLETLQEPSAPEDEGEQEASS